VIDLEKKFINNKYVYSY